MSLDTLIAGSYFLAAVLFILGLKAMSSPAGARRGIVWAGLGMVLATVVTFFWPGMKPENLLLIGAAIIVGGVPAWISGRRVAMTGMPQMIALYNGMGGGAAAAIAWVELLRGGHGGEEFGWTVIALAVTGALIGAVSFSGSLLAFAKLEGWLKRSLRFAGQNVLNLVILLVAVGAGVLVIMGVSGPWLTVFIAVALLLGLTLTMPIGGADMPVVISLYNALTGLAVGLEGLVLDNAAMIIAGTVVGAAGTLLTQLMAKAMNRSLANVLFSAFGETAAEGDEIEGTMKPVEAIDAAVMLGFARQVIIIPGYGMAVAQAQHKVWELAEALMKRGVRVKFAIHPVAGRMPGHMNVLLAEAGVPYDLIFDEAEINPEFGKTDVALVIGANDVVNTAARTDTASPIYGMPILDADKANNAIVIKRGKGTGFSGIENALFYEDRTRMLYGDGQAKCAELIRAVQEI